MDDGNRKRMKQFIRRQLLSKRSSQAEWDRKQKNSSIKKRLKNLPEFKSSKVILLYVSIRGEVKTEFIISEALEEDKRVLVPFVDLQKREMLISEIRDLDDLEPGAFGIPEPRNPQNFPLDEIDLVITPGVAFDRKGNRIGFGTGFYDDFLKKLKKKIPFIALAYDFQIVREIHPEEYDVRIDKIVTDKEIIECSG